MPAGDIGLSEPSSDFYTVIAPSDPRLPNGGGYRILGLNTEGLNQPIGAPGAQTINPDLEYYWHGIDTNVVWQGPWGLRVNGGTSTNHASRDTCLAMFDAPSVGGAKGTSTKQAAVQCRGRRG